MNTTTKPWNYEHENYSFFTPARIIGISLIFFVFFSIVFVIIINCLKEKEKKRNTILEFNFNEDTELDEILY